LSLIDPLEKTMVVVIVAMVLILGLVLITIFNNNVFAVMRAFNMTQYEDKLTWHNEMNKGHDRDNVITSSELLEQAQEVMEEAENEAYWNTIKAEDAVRELEQIEQEMNRLID
jgi:hypothetical protein